ncbi:hypothetical protein JCM1841_002325 [Sporobolomyces salmonicolor]
MRTFLLALVASFAALAAAAPCPETGSTTTNIGSNDSTTLLSPSIDGNSGILSPSAGNGSANGSGNGNSAGNGNDAGTANGNSASGNGNGNDAGTVNGNSGNSAGNGSADGSGNGSGGSGSADGSNAGIAGALEGLAKGF